MWIRDKEDGLTHRMPAHIIRYDPTQGGLCPYDDVTSISISYLTDMQPLRELIPDDFDFDEIARLHELWRIEPNPHTRRRSGSDDIARVQCDPG